MAKKPKHNLGKEFELMEDNAKDSPVKDIHWQGREMSVESDTKLEDDRGSGEAIIIRTFSFGVNPKAWKEYIPTKQELFNSHIKGMEVILWKDGLTIFHEVTPRVIFSKDKKIYQIFVGAKPARGHTLVDKPRTLSKIIHET